MSATIRRIGPFALVAIAAMITLLEYWVQDPIVKGTAAELGDWVVTILAFAMMMATVRAYIYHVREVQKRTRGTWYFNAWFLVLVTVLIAIGVYQTPKGAQYYWWTTWVYSMIYNGFTALTAAWVVATVFRAFRMRNIYAAGCAVALALYLFGWILPIGGLVPGLPFIAGWLYTVPLTAAWRGLLVGSGIGGILYAIKVILGTERRIFGV